MTALVRSFAATFLLLVPFAGLSQTQPTASEVSFHFEHPGLPVPMFTLTVDETGTARYEAEEAATSRGAPDADPPPTQHISRTVTLSKAATEKIFANARALDRFNTACASKAKNIADTGSKTLHYSGYGGDGSCTYNFSENKRVVVLTELFTGIARTLDVGRRLDFQHRFDRLGLDATIASLAEEVDAGRAVEVSVITPTLRSLADDGDLLQRVRQRAARLLQAAQSPS
ncbi:hypothetical protein HDF16_003640 [Granulicella aggregans]|uniref:LPP20 lipoprotein n=1 Tax=Granulicella aggregans TaxID=474949 RepID=A0A7W7ZFL8_9BACT|nr:hypothetical protein [Granulicella aggregans]MBB5058917.1 hypothetical protein [Granulicella aggregans]